MSDHPDEVYLAWLYGQTANAGLKNPARTHWKLLRQLYKKEFVWIVPNDDNRMEDGKELRYEFLVDSPLPVDDDWMHLGCSMLEMLIALSRRLYFLTDVEPHEWFWELLENVGISMAGSNDLHYNDKLESYVDMILDRIIWRTYAPDGNGGLFPLSSTDKDQRKIEIWYQMSAYLAPDV